MPLIGKKKFKANKSDNNAVGGGGGGDGGGNKQSKKKKGLKRILTLGRSSSKNNKSTSKTKGRKLPERGYADLPVRPTRYADLPVKPVSPQSASWSRPNDHDPPSSFSTHTSDPPADPLATASSADADFDDLIVPRFDGDDIITPLDGCGSSGSGNFESIAESGTGSKSDATPSVSSLAAVASRSHDSSVSTVKRTGASPRARSANNAWASSANNVAVAPFPSTPDTAAASLTPESSPEKKKGRQQQQERQWPQQQQQQRTVAAVTTEPSPEQREQEQQPQQQPIAAPPAAGAAISVASSDAVTAASSLLSAPSDEAGVLAAVSSPENEQTEQIASALDAAAAPAPAPAAASAAADFGSGHADALEAESTCGDEAFEVNSRCEVTPTKTRKFVAIAAYGGASVAPSVVSQDITVPAANRGSMGSASDDGGDGDNASEATSSRDILADLDSCASDMSISGGDHHVAVQRSFSSSHGSRGGSPKKKRLRSTKKGGRPGGLPPLPTPPRSSMRLSEEPGEPREEGPASPPKKEEEEGGARAPAGAVSEDGVTTEAKEDAEEGGECDKNEQEKQQRRLPLPKEEEEAMDAGPEEAEIGSQGDYEEKPHREQEPQHLPRQEQEPEQPYPKEGAGELPAAAPISEAESPSQQEGTAQEDATPPSPVPYPLSRERSELSVLLDGEEDLGDGEGDDDGHGDEGGAVGTSSSELDGGADAAALVDPPHGTDESEADDGREDGGSAAAASGAAGSRITTSSSLGPASDGAVMMMATTTTTVAAPLTFLAADADATPPPRKEEDEKEESSGGSSRPIVSTTVVSPVDISGDSAGEEGVEVMEVEVELSTEDQDQEQEQEQHRQGEEEEGRRDDLSATALNALLRKISSDTAHDDDERDRCSVLDERERLEAGKEKGEVYYTISATSSPVSTVHIHQDDATVDESCITDADYYGNGRRRCDTDGASLVTYEDGTATFNASTYDESRYTEEEEDVTINTEDDDDEEVEEQDELRRALDATGTAVIRKASRIADDAWYGAKKILTGKWVPDEETIDGGTIDGTVDGY